jgi:hypothetical protein
MRRAASRLLPRLSHSFHTSGGAADVAKPSATFPGWLGPSLGSTRVSTPLTKALPGTSQRNGYAVPLEPPPTEVTTLGNGVRIVSEASTVRAPPRSAAAAVVQVKGPPAGAVRTHLERLPRTYRAPSPAWAFT